MYVGLTAIARATLPWRPIFKSSHYTTRLKTTQIAKFMGTTWGPHGSCRSQMGPMLAPWSLLSRQEPEDALTAVTPKYPDLRKGQILFDVSCVCLVDADPITIKFPWTRDVCFDRVHDVPLFVTDLITSYVITFTDTYLKIVHPVTCKIASIW